MLVVSEGKLVGIVSERDYARKVILKGKMSRDTKVSEIMSSPVTAVDLECTTDECMRLVTEKHIRHLPVVDQGELVGVISIGDLVKAIVSVQAETIQYLSDYIEGKHTQTVATPVLK